MARPAWAAAWRCHMRDFTKSASRLGCFCGCASPSISTRSTASRSIIVFLLLLPESPDSEPLGALASIARKLRKPEIADRLARGARQRRNVSHAHRRVSGRLRKRSDKLPNRSDRWLTNLSSIPIRCRAAASPAGCLRKSVSPTASRLLDYATTMKAPAYLAVNPMGKVPALRHGDIVVTETAAICAYLADAFPQAGLAPPPGDRLRGPYYRWLFFTAGPVEAAVSNKALGFVVPPERERMMGYGRIEHVMSALEAALSRCRLSGRRQLHRRRPLRRLPTRIRHDVRHHREASCLRAILATDQRAPRVQAREGTRRCSGARRSRQALEAALGLPCKAKRLPLRFASGGLGLVAWVDVMAPRMRDSLPRSMGPAHDRGNNCVVRRACHSRTATRSPPKRSKPALAKAYQNNPQLNAQRAIVRQSDEGVPPALSGYRPTISANATVGREYTDTKQEIPPLPPVCRIGRLV